MYRHLIQKGLVSNQISVLVDIRLVQAMNTACCERGFSRMKLIKTASRNRLYVETLDALELLFRSVDIKTGPKELPSKQDLV